MLDCRVCYNLLYIFKFVKNKMERIVVNKIFFVFKKSEKVKNEVCEKVIFCESQEI